MRPPALRPNTSPVTICFNASVWIREKYENFILSSYWKRGKYKIYTSSTQHHPTQPTHHNNSPQSSFVLLPRFGYEKSMKILYLPHIGNEESIKFYTFLVSNTRKVCNFLKWYINIQSKYINVQKVYQVHQYF